MEWQPIETAPKAKKPMIVVIARLPSGYLSDPYCVWYDEYRVGALSDWVRWPHSFPPTHWMPLPAPPNSARAKQARGGAGIDDDMPF